MNEKEIDYDGVIDSVVHILGGYASTKRKTTNPWTLANLKQNNAIGSYDPESILVRESLLEHVGSLPVVAAHLFPYLNDERVSLGDALVMLSVHDVGEIVTGDEIAFKKGKETSNEESIAAHGLIHTSLHRFYQEIEQEPRVSPSALFAKSVDKITPDFIDYITPVEITKVRYAHYMNCELKDLPDLIVAYKRPFMLWNPFLTKLHIRLIERLSQKLSR